MDEKRIDEVRNIIKKYDPRLITAAVNEMGMDEENLKIAEKGITDALEKMSGDEKTKLQVLSVAQTEIEKTIIKKEIEKIKIDLKNFSKETIETVLNEMGIIGVCLRYEIDPCVIYDIICLKYLISPCSLYKITDCRIFLPCRTRIDCWLLMPYLAKCLFPIQCRGRTITVMQECSASLFAFDIIDEIDVAKALEKLTVNMPVFAPRIKKMLEEMKKAGEL